MPRFYYPHPFKLNELVVLPDSIGQHCRVLRLATGDVITLFNGEGGEYSAVLSLITKQQISAEITAFSARDCELPYAITLVQALPENSKIDWIMEKAVELGAAVIQPIETQRCVTRLAPERAIKKHAHWQRILIAAAEQSGRNRLPVLKEGLRFNQWVSEPHVQQQRIVLSPTASQSLADWARQHAAQAVALCIGPEGGLTAEEETMAYSQQVLPLSLGKRILRTETAGLTAIAVLNAMWDVG